MATGASRFDDYALLDLGQKPVDQKQGGKDLSPGNATADEQLDALANAYKHEDAFRVVTCCAGQGEIDP